MSIKVETIYPAFLESLLEIFETMVMLDLKAGEPLAKEHAVPKGSIVGSLSITSDLLTINLSLVFGIDLANAVFRAMMGMEESDPVTTEEVSDIIGELANMTSGGAKTRLEDQHPRLQLGLPSVVVGKELHVEPPKNTQTLVIPLEAEAGNLFLELAISG